MTLADIVVSQSDLFGNPFRLLDDAGRVICLGPGCVGELWSRRAAALSGDRCKGERRNFLLSDDSAELQ